MGAQQGPTAAQLLDFLHGVTQRAPIPFQGPEPNHQQCFQIRQQLDAVLVEAARAHEEVAALRKQACDLSEDLRMRVLQEHIDALQNGGDAVVLPDEKTLEETKEACGGE